MKWCYTVFIAAILAFSIWEIEQSRTIIIVLSAILLLKSIAMCCCCNKGSCKMDSKEAKPAKKKK